MIMYAPIVSIVQLRYSFIDAGTQQPVRIGRTHMTFYDFDTSRAGMRECMQAKGGVVSTSVSEDTTLEEVDNVSAVLLAGP